MDDPKKDTENLNIVETQDGSATVDLPENMAIEAVEGEDLDNSDRNASKNDQNDDISDDSDTDEELRMAKRNRRKAKKELVRKTNQEKDARIAQLQRENEEFRRRFTDIEKNVRAEKVVRIEKNIDDANVRLEYAKMKLAEATQNNDGQAMVEAQTLWSNAQDEVRTLKAQQRQAAVDAKRAQNAGPNIDPQAQRLANDWIRRNSWYDPQGRDADSRVAKKVDELLFAKGLNPGDSEYWEELDMHLQKELPHRYNEDDENDSHEVRRPRNVVGSSGREAPAAYGGVNRNQFVLSPARVKAMKEAGAWDNPDRKKKMIKQFIEFDRQNGRN